MRFGCSDAKCPNDCDTMNAENIRFANGGPKWESFDIDVKIICLKGLLITYPLILDNICYTLSSLIFKLIVIV